MLRPEYDGYAVDMAGWVLTAHALALGVGTALFGRLSEKWGVRTTLLTGALLLAAGATLCLLLHPPAAPWRLIPDHD